MKSKGFTLIELLVVIAIIGILASVVLASLNTARSKGADAAVKSSLANTRAQAELYYDNNTQSYNGLCSQSGGINTMVLSAANATGITSVNNGTTTASSLGVAVCHDSPTAWAAAVQLKTAPTSYWCVDSTGKSASSSTGVSGTSPNQYVCGN